MKAVVYKGPFDVVLEDVPKPRLGAAAVGDQFDKRLEGWTKALLQPGQAA